MDTVVPSLPKNPELEPVFLINLKISGNPENIFSDRNRNKALIFANVESGRITTVKNKFGFELDVEEIHGIDDITNHISDGYNELDCKLYGKTKSGKGVYVTYTGVIQLNQPTVDVLTGQNKDCSIEDAYVTNNPKVQFDEDVEDKYKWAIKENLLGKGRFVRDDQGGLYVQYFVYVVR